MYIYILFKYVYLVGLNFLWVSVEKIPYWILEESNTPTSEVVNRAITLCRRTAGCGIVEPSCYFVVFFIRVVIYSCQFVF